MPTKRSDVTKKAGAKKAPATASTPAAIAPEKTQAPAAPPPAPQADSERASVLAELIRGGMSFNEAKAAIEGTGTQAGSVQVKIDIGKDPGADEVIDPDSIPDVQEDLEVVEISHVPEGDLKSIEQLYYIRDDLEKSRKRRLFAFVTTLEQDLFDWLLYATIAEATYRGRADLTIEDFITIKLKELKAADPSHGGRRQATSSGLRGSYNPATGKWE